MRFTFCLLAASLLSLASSIYNEEQSNINIWLSGAAYCDKESYLSMQLSGPAQGFLVKDVIYDTKTDLQGYIGVLPSAKSIHVVFRGTDSVKNWIDDLKVLKTNYTTFPDCFCEVHKGFYMSALSVADQTAKTVAKLMGENPAYSVITTGHSYGAGVTQFMSMELLARGIPNQVYNYGQPRTGDQEFATFYNKYMHDYWRFTHNADIVPHVPPIKMNYIHSCGEVFEDASGATHFCSETECEDPTCADQYSLIHTNIPDHETYLGHYVGCDTSTL